MAEVDTVVIDDGSGVEREVATTSKLIKSVGLPADPKNPAIDTTPATLIGILKQISEYLSSTPSALSSMVDSLIDIEAAAETPGDVGMSPGAGSVISGTISVTNSMGPTDVIPQQALGVAVALTHFSITVTNTSTITIYDGLVPKMVFHVPSNNQVNINLTKALLGSASSPWRVGSSLATSTYHVNMIGYTVTVV